MRLRVIVAMLASVSLVFAGCDSGSSSSGDEAKSESEQEQSSSEESPEKSAKKKNKKKKAGADELPYEATGPVAVVNGNEIGAEQYNEIVEKQAGKMRRQLPHRIAKRFKTKTLDRVVETTLIEKEIDEAGIEATEKDVEEKFAEFKERFPNEKAFQSFLDQRKTSVDEMKTQMKKDVALRKLLKQRKDIEVSDKDAKTHYEENEKDYKEPEKVEASHILIDAKKSASDKKVEKARERAEKLAKKAKKEGTDFSKLAEEKSDGPSASKGGDLGYFSRERMVPKFSEKAFSMKNGEIAGPVRTQFGFHVIKRTGHKEGNKKSFEEAKSEILEELEREKLRKAMDSFIEGLKEDAEIERKPDNIVINVEKRKKGGGGALGGLGGAGGGKNLKMKLKQLKKKAKKRAKEQGGESGSAGAKGGGEGKSAE